MIEEKLGKQVLLFLHSGLEKQLLKSYLMEYYIIIQEDITQMMV